VKVITLLVLATTTGFLGAAPPPELTIAQVQYGGGGDWYANPSGLPNLLREIRARTGLRISERPMQLRLTDPNLWTQPYI
jgi:hypothetical protein